MDKTGQLLKTKESSKNLAVDGLLFGLVGGIAMAVILLAFALISGEAPATLLARFGTGNSTSPLQGLLSHLAVSATYGLLFGTVFWPLLKRLSSPKQFAWLGGIVYAVLLLLLSQFVLLPSAHSPLLQIPFWEWAAGHLVYGMVLGYLFARNVD